MKVATEYMTKTFENLGVCFLKKTKLGGRSGGGTTVKLGGREGGWSKHTVCMYEILKKKVLSKNK